MTVHYRLAPYCPGSGQWETTCKLVATYENTTYDRGKVDCSECRDNKFFQDMERVFGKTVSPVKEASDVS